MRRLLMSAGLVLVVVVVAWVSHTQQRKQPLAILLVTIDTLRADALGSIGGGSHTPVLDRLANEGALFDAAVSAAPTTGPSHTSILSGQFPWRHGYRNNGQSVAAATPMLAPLLQARGMATAAFVSGFPLNHAFGFGRGFEHYDDVMGATNDPNSAASERNAETTTRAAQAWLAAQTGRSWMAWVHYYDPHAPYQSHEGFRQSGDRADYLSEVAYVDHWLGELVRTARAVDPDVVIVVTSDHGEGLGDHDELDHGLLLYESTIRAPLLIVAPGRFARQRSGAAVRSVDIVPTLLGLAGIAVTTDLDGVDLTPLLQGRSMRLPPAYSETYFGSLTYGWAPLRALRDGAAKRIEGARSRYFDLATDPDEAHAVDGAATDARLESLLAATPALAPTSDANDPASAAALAKLRSLGYLGAGSNVDAARWNNAIDPEDRLGEHNQIWAAQVVMDSGDLRMAEARFRAILELSPDNRVAWLRLGALLTAQRRIDAASEALQRAVDLDPLNAEAQYQLAAVLTDQRRYRDAVAHWAEVTRLQPTRAVAWSNLGTVLLMDGQFEPAVDALQQAVRLQPDAADLRENLARAQIRAGRHADAAESLLALQQQREGDRFRLAALLALQLAGAGRIDDAERWLAASWPRDEAHADAHIALARILASDDRTRAQTHVTAARAATRAADAVIAADPVLRGLAEQP